MHAIESRKSTVTDLGPHADAWHRRRCALREAVSGSAMSLYWLINLFGTVDPYLQIVALILAYAL